VAKIQVCDIWRVVSNFDDGTTPKCRRQTDTIAPASYVRLIRISAVQRRETHFWLEKNRGYGSSENINRPSILTILRTMVYVTFINVKSRR
jgi:hypothetical protein